MPFIIVLGAGVIGLSTALTLQDRGYEVQIVAELFPEDPINIRYISQWAGAHHVSMAGNDVRQQQMDRETFAKMWEMSEPGKDSEKCFMRIPQIEYYKDKRAEANCLETMPKFRYLNKGELIPDAKEGVSFQTLTIDMPVYLPYLDKKFRERGGKINRASIHHISQLAHGAYSDGHKPDAILVCTGLGARFLGGVEDQDVYPIRGQTVLLRAPWIKFGRTFSDLKAKVWTYIIPRRSGDIIVGGSLGIDNWEPRPEREETEGILRRALALAPELSPKYAQNSGHIPSVAELRELIIAENCGLRPGRKGGIRLESDRLVLPNGPSVPVVYNYGHGGYGVMSSWGSASIAADLVSESVRKTRREGRFAKL